MLKLALAGGGGFVAGALVATLLLVGFYNKRAEGLCRYAQIRASVPMSLEETMRAQAYVDALCPHPFDHLPGERDLVPPAQ